MNRTNNAEWFPCDNVLMEATWKLPKPSACPRNMTYDTHGDQPQPPIVEQTKEDELQRCCEATS
jgi:hypothetical protein